MHHFDPDLIRDAAEFVVFCRNNAQPKRAYDAEQALRDAADYISRRNAEALADTPRSRLSQIVTGKVLRGEAEPIAERPVHTLGYRVNAECALAAKYGMEFAVGAIKARTNQARKAFEQACRDEANRIIAMRTEH